MVLLKRDGIGEGRRLEGAKVYLRHPQARDYEAWSRLREVSRAFLTPWEPTWAQDELGRASFRDRLRRYHDDAREGRAYAFLCFRKDDDTLVGGTTLGQVRRGAAQSATLGYWVGHPFRRCGYTRDAALVILDFAFEELGLHRIEASCLPENAASQGLLAQIGFRLEGRLRGYLRIDGEWRDHLYFGLLRGEQSQRNDHQ